MNGKIIKHLCQLLRMEHRNSVPYHPQMNGTVEAANENIKNIFMKMTNTYKDWHAICLVRLSHFCSYFHECNPVFLGVRHGSRPPSRGRDPIS